MRLAKTERDRNFKGKIKFGKLLSSMYNGPMGNKSANRDLSQLTAKKGKTKYQEEFIKRQLNSLVIDTSDISGGSKSRLGLGPSSTSMLLLKELKKRKYARLNHNLRLK